MDIQGLVEVKVSKIVHAKRWRVIRQLTRVWEFPSYIPTIKEAQVIYRGFHKMKTRWKVVIEGVPISWVEEDRFAFDNNAIYFNAIEGDLQVFKGRWLFLEHPEGTEVRVDIVLKVGIPTIKDFAEDYVRTLVRENIENILELLESRLISIRYSSYRRGDLDKIAGFGIIGHLYNYNHLVKCLKMLRPQAKLPSREFLSSIYHISPSFKMKDIRNFKSKTGQLVDGYFIVATFIPDMMEKSLDIIFSKVVRACRIAEKYGVGIVALGGFTSIIGERIGQQIAGAVDVPITTGNTFTSALAVDGVIKAAKMIDLDICRAKIAIIGGTGDIGSACARALVGLADEIVITGRTKSNLRILKNELSRHRGAKITSTTDNRKAVGDADIVIAAASVSASILDINWFRPGAIVCDVGYPKNIPYVAPSRKDILIFSGGLAKTPTPIDFPVDIGLPSNDTIYGCFAEAIVLALERRFENFSFGRGNITLEKMDLIRELGKKHGFEVSEFYWGDKLLEEEVLNRTKELVSSKV